MKIYKLGDWWFADRKALGLDRSDGSLLPKVVGKVVKVGAISTGEHRPPKAGEWYLSGAIVEAYRAPNDLSSSYHIAKLVRYKEVTTEVII